MSRLRATTASSRASRSRRSTRGCAPRPRSDAAASSRASSRSTSRGRPAQVPAAGHCQRDHLSRAPRPAPLPRSARRRTARRAGPPSRRRGGAGLLDALPERVVVLLDEALRDFVDAEPRDAALALLADHPRLLVFRTFSKAWGLAGLRCGSVVGGPGAEPLLTRLEPELGVNELGQAGALEALRTAAGIVAGRAAAVARERARLAAGAAAAGLHSAPSQANVLWLAARGVDGAELAGRLERGGVFVAPGGALGDPARVRLTVPPDPAGADRALRALESAVAPGAAPAGASAHDGRGSTHAP